MSELVDGVLAGAPGEELARLPLPETFRAVYLRKEDVGMFGDEAVPDVRRSMHVGEVGFPELAPDEVVVAVMASGINYNTAWSAMFQPVPTFTFLEHYGRQDRWGARHDLDYQVVGSDAAGIIVRTGSAVRQWRPGDRVVVIPSTDDSAELNPANTTKIPRAWGYETNFGGLADFTVVKMDQLLPKPNHLTWEEAAINTLCAMTAYRMLVGPHGARMKQGDIVLLWGAAGGLGSYGVQLVKNGGGIPVAVVSSDRKARLVRELGCDVVLDRREFGDTDGALREPKTWRRIGRAIRDAVGEDPHIVFEHTGRETFSASVFLARSGGTVVTCGSSSGYRHEYDNRYLWMNLKSIVGSHGASPAEAAETNRLFSLGALIPALSASHPLEEAGEATRSVQLGEHLGKVAVRCLAPHDGLGIEDHELRARIDEERLTLFRKL
ncbi:crotonyl-CoA reductase [Lipingzhangella halophila]|uniref:Crotonyl-CoA reductase n=1 Tax=Lipingzhangella halophila TaxID=1783352 RepID=A0A7W7RKK1_9ACTN|nr:crotonyl-CoA carboxylase/reductase [Lipingzhangella halophila]MBB4933692.1 crotonyl-CoA reductase [Lipingzhangella halophila]